MLLRMSTLFVRTLRDDPADAEVPSHRLLVRAGYVRRIAPGIFSWLPLGYLVYRNIEGIVRAEMDAAGFQEVHFPALLPREPYERTNRWEEYGDNLFRLQDRKGGDYLLGPTHEEMFTLMVKGEYSSYKDLPLVIYQIQTKYRDEARPRAGILRGREFVMKDSYSFDVEDAGLERSYHRHRDAYISCFDRLNLTYVIVSAQSGAMGGSQSEEFLAPTEYGEDTYVRCMACDYAANIEAVVSPHMEPRDTTDLPPAQVHDTPDTPTIATLVEVSNAREDTRRSDRPWTAADTLKNVVFLADYPDGTTAPLAVGVPGDREVDVKRLEAALHPVALRPFEESDFVKYPALVKGYIGPGALGGEGNVRYLVDPRVAMGSAWITGANQPGRHVYGLVRGRDFDVDGQIEAVEIIEGDPCPQCGASVELARGIEIGHIFQLGRKYADALGLTVLDEHGKQVTVTMGSYGLGVSRAVAAVAEQHYDDKGLVWPREVAPADIHIVATGKDDAPFDTAEAIAAGAISQGLRVLIDDRRGVSPGVKFKDSELIGIPTIVVVGKRLADGVVELRDRASGDSVDVAVGDIVERLVEVCR
ncbi:MAG: proline--tRNA ligase [Candidatus Nanopelagicales bacterium]|nr:proline--tRNA ligase [Candidatus Nanopelagicales bacterium]MDP4905810.1 proline--tRNA ligase [Candidatus Nanopelagicales bacterium]MDP5094286.1 proline--tRNA ligase [Candidatus Nanopelagicales bacterium]